MTSAVRSTADWLQDNEQGVRLAADGGWEDASLSFEAAARRLSASGTGEPETHEALALVLGNLASACYRAGRIDDAIAHGQRACALREALAGEDAMTVARMRSDLAVMLASAGRADEAPALLDRAIAAIERTVGEEDPSLVPVLENAARAALLLGRPSNAEPVLLRLHALLDAHGADTSVAERLLGEVAATRSAPNDVTAVESAPAVESIDPIVEESGPAADAAAAAPAAREHPGGSDEAEDPDEPESEDQPLRDAVRLTDALLRTTPSGVPAIRDAEVTETSSAFDGFDDELELVPHREVAAARPQPPAADAAPPASAKPGLGFEVQYGVPLESDHLEQGVASASTEPADAPAPAPEPAVHAAPDPMGDLELIDVTSEGSSAPGPRGETGPLAPQTTERIEPESVAASAGLAATPTQSSPTPRSAVVLPTGDGGHAMSRPTTNTEDREIAALRSRLAETAEGNAPRRAPRVTGGESKPKGRGAAIGGMVGLAAAAAAGWFLFRGGFF